MKLSKIRIDVVAKIGPRLWQPPLIITVYALTITCSGLLYGTAGVFIAWACLGVGGGLGVIVGIDFDRTRRTGPVRRLEREHAERGARLVLVEEQNAALVRLNAKAKEDLALAIETSESHYAEILRLRVNLAGETP